MSTFRWPRRACAVALAAGLLARPLDAAAGEDDWTGRDKRLHFAVSAGLAGAGYGAAAPFTPSPPLRVAAGAGLALGAGIAKELVDIPTRGDASFRDLAADVVGTATGLAVAWLVDRYVFGASPASINAARSGGASRDPQALSRP